MQGTEKVAEAGANVAGGVANTALDGAGAVAGAAGDAVGGLLTPRSQNEVWIAHIPHARAQARACPGTEWALNRCFQDFLGPLLSVVLNVGLGVCDALVEGKGGAVMSVIVRSVRNNITAPCGLFGCDFRPWPTLPLSAWLSRAVLSFRLCRAQAQPFVSVGWALSCCFAWTFGTAAVLVQGEGGIRAVRARAPPPPRTHTHTHHMHLWTPRCPGPPLGIWPLGLAVRHLPPGLPMALHNGKCALCIIVSALLRRAIPFRAHEPRSGRSSRHHFFLLRTAPRDHQPPTAANRQRRPTANRQPQPTTTNRQLPTANRRQPPPTATNHG